MRTMSTGKARARLVRFSGSLMLIGWLVGSPGPRLSAQTRSAPRAPVAAQDRCAMPANRIVAENCKPGNTREEWDVYGQGDSEIQGFATDMSVNLGETVAFKVKTHSPKYRIDIYRMGWYGGSGARLQETIRPAVPLPQVQPDCKVGPFRLVDCGNWAVSASWLVPVEAVSGVYIARLVREDDEPIPWRSEGQRNPPDVKPPASPHSYGASGFGKLRDAIKEPRASLVFFVVRDDSRRSDMLLQTSDATWVALNRYGDASTADPGARANKVSYNRPITNRDGVIPAQFFNSEYPLVRWLERNGYDVSYFAEVDTDRRGDTIRNHKVFLTAGYDAFWSGAQRTHVEAARDAGVNLAFLSGQTMFWRTRYEPSIDGSKTPYRTLVCFKETLAAGKIDPHKDEWTGTWRDSGAYNPIGPKPENALTGTIGTVGGFRNDRLGLSAEYAKLRFWRNTDVANMTGSDTIYLGKGVLGHTWDEDLDNGSRPAGLVHLSETVVDGVEYVQDPGSVYDSGTGTHHLTLYRAPSGALVFSAASAQYSWGLDPLHTYFTRPSGPRVRPDPSGVVKAMQQATVNLFADMGVQPATLQRDLVPAEPSQDKTEPISEIETQRARAVGGELMTITGTATDGGGSVAAVEVSVDGGATWHPAAGADTWSYEWRVPHDLEQAVILSRATDDSNNMETPGEGWRLTIPDL